MGIRARRNFEGSSFKELDQRQNELCASRPVLVDRRVRDRLILERRFQLSSLWVCLKPKVRDP